MRLISQYMNLFPLTYNGIMYCLQMRLYFISVQLTSYENRSPTEKLVGRVIWAQGEQVVIHIIVLVSQREWSGWDIHRTETSYY